MGMIEKWVESLDYEYGILPSCSRHQSPRSTCERCLNVCPEEAIQLQEGKPVIQHESCTECGACVTECPVQAVEGFLPKRTIIEKHLIVEGEEPPSHKELLILYSKGIVAISSENGILPQSWEKRIEEAGMALRQLGEEPFKIVLKKIEKEEETFTRREIFTFWRKEAEATVKSMTPAKWRFNHQDMDLAKHYREFQFTDIQVDTKKCTICKACAILCKKNSLTFHDNGLEIHAQTCSGCMLCQDICPEKAITIMETISPAMIKVIPFSTKICDTCHKSYQTLHSQDTKCVMCKKKEEFGIFLS